MHTHEGYTLPTALGTTAPLSPKKMAESILTISEDFPYGQVKIICLLEGTYCFCCNQLSQFSGSLTMMGRKLQNLANIKCARALLQDQLPSISWFYGFVGEKL